MQTTVIVKRVLRVLHQDGILDCNQYQGKDFDNLIKKISLTDTLAKETANKIIKKLRG